MEKIVKQKFWILLGVGIIMTITGWWMATGTMASTITTRKGEVEKAFSRIPGGEIPNTDWSTQLAARNADQERAVKYTALGLWERQKSRMFWPDTVYEFAWQNGYRGDIALSGRENYRTAYGRDVRRVWESVRPFKMIDGSGIVVFGQDERALQQVTWGRLAPQSAEMWDAQEDLWLLESLLQSIVRINGGPNGERGDAYIHVIDKLELCGGVPAAQRKAAGGSSTTTGGTAGPAGAHAGMGPPMTLSGNGGMGEGRGAAGAAMALATADFDRRDEFGDDGSSKAGVQQGGSATPNPSAGHGPGGAASMTGLGTGATASSSVKRYIDDDAALPYKTRGFYMSVIMDHRKIPSLIAELSANELSVWPVEIVRLQMVRMYDDDVGSGTNTGFGAPTGRASPMAGFGGAGFGGSGFGGTGFTGPATFPGSDGEGFTRPPTTDLRRDTEAPNPNNLQQVAGAVALLENALQDPFMARVALCGTITLYKEVKPEPVTTPAAPSTAPSAAPVAGNPAETTPAAADANADKTAPADDKPAEKAPADGEKPADAKPADEKPADPAATPEPKAEGDAAPKEAAPAKEPAPKEPAPQSK